VKHTASQRFWGHYADLPAEVRTLADKNFQRLKRDPSHPSLHFKLLGGGKVYSARVGLYYRALGLPRDGGVHWFWIGTHAEYDKLIAT
jgi:hypothetical protein